MQTHEVQTNEFNLLYTIITRGFVHCLGKLPISKNRFPCASTLSKISDKTAQDVDQDQMKTFIQFVQTTIEWV